MRYFATFKQTKEYQLSLHVYIQFFYSLSGISRIKIKVPFFEMQFFWNLVKMHWRKQAMHDIYT